MRRKLLVLVVALTALVVFSVTSCIKDKEPVVETCDTKPRTYNGDIKLIIETYCVVCHKPGGAFSSLPLTSYIEVKNAAQNGKLLNSIKQDGTAVAMPQGGGKLSDADIAKIDCWVSKNYPE